MKTVLIALTTFLIASTAYAQQNLFFAQASQTQILPGTEIRFEIRFPICVGWGLISICDEAFNVATLDSIEALFKSHPSLKVEIVNHTDARGNESMNREFSQKQAEIIKSCLIGRNIDESQLTAIGKGESDPIHTEAEINQFRKTDQRQFEMMHHQNRRTILRVVEI